jgi:hypothetical protein
MGSPLKFLKMKSYYNGYPKTCDKKWSHGTGDLFSLLSLSGLFVVYYSLHFLFLKVSDISHIPHFEFGI